MRLSNRTAFTAVVFVLLGPALAQAQKKDSDTLTISNSQQQVVVLNTVVDRVNQTLTIRGLSFGSPAPQVWCETYLLSVISATDTELVVFLPAAVPDGTHLLSVVRGPSEKDRGFFNMSVGTPGRGPTGPAGPAGPKGDTGAVGPKGDTGAAGSKGDMGAIGPKGDTGAVGPKGDTGAAGPKGDTGAAGPKGDAGVAGPVGPQGDVGPVGPVGPTGAVGPQGEVGSAGPTGAVGPKGDMGATGATGAKGDTGATGATGPQGPQGPMGLMGPLGPQGLPGVSGYFIASTPSTTVTVAGNSTTSMSVSCPAGKNVIGGGYESNQGAGTYALHPIAMFPSAADTWRVTLRVSGINNAVTITFRVYAICAAS
jgi:hypothetical protein